MHSIQPIDLNSQKDKQSARVCDKNLSKVEIQIWSNVRKYSSNSKVNGDDNLKIKNRSSDQPDVRPFRIAHNQVRARIQTRNVRFNVKSNRSIG